MKKNWINFLGCIAIGLAIFTSCNKDNVEPVDTNDPEVTGEAMFSAIINNLPTDLTASADDGITRAAGDEDKVTDIRVVLFTTAANGPVEYSWDMGVRYTGSGFFGPDVADSGTGNFTTTARLVKYQNYHMVVLVNASEELREATTVGKTKQTFEAAHVSANLAALIGQSSGVNNTSSSYRFFMSNADSYILVDKEQNLKPTKEAAEGAPVPLKVERAVAKVLVLSQLITDDAYLEDYDIASVTWKLDITNKKTFWMRKPGKTPTGGTESATTTDPDRYAVDPNFTNFSGDTGLSTEFNYITATDIPTTQTWGTGNWEYVMENTMDADEQMQDVTTRVIVRANYIPLRADIKDGNITAGVSYYTYMGYFISQAQMANYQSATNQSALPEHYPLLYKAIEDAKNAGHILSGTGPTASFSTDSGLSFYKDGISYYKILIRHFTNSQTNNRLMAYGRYGVVRNNEYSVNITSFNGVGDIDIPGTGDPDPDEEEENWVSAKVTIKPWVQRSQGNDL